MLNEELIIKMIEFNNKDPKRIQHFLKVYNFAYLIGIKEGIDSKTQKILNIASIMHDIGIKPSEQKYGLCNGKLQEKEGPIYAREILKGFKEVTSEEIERVCYLIAHHHTYENIDGIDYQILIEADFLVNAYEDKMDKQSICSFRDKIFKTKTGLYLLNIMYGL